MNESEDTEEIQHSPSTHTCCKDSRPCPTVSQYQLDALVTQDTQHLCHTQPSPVLPGKFTLYMYLSFSSFVTGFKFNFFDSLLKLASGIIFYVLNPSANLLFHTYKRC